MIQRNHFLKAFFCFFSFSGFLRSNTCFQVVETIVLNHCFIVRVYFQTFFQGSDILVSLLQSIQCQRFTGISITCIEFLLNSNIKESHSFCILFHFVCSHTTVICDSRILVIRLFQILAEFSISYGIVLGIKSVASFFFQLARVSLSENVSHSKAKCK